MRHCGFSSAAAMGWLRVVRPGSVIGPQQHYLRDFGERGTWSGNQPVLPPPTPAHPPCESGGVGGGERRPAESGAEASAGELARQITAGMAQRGQARAGAAGSVAGTSAGGAGAATGGGDSHAQRGTLPPSGR
jgi:hypothetical protein